MRAVARCQRATHAESIEANVESRSGCRSGSGHGDGDWSRPMRAGIYAAAGVDHGRRTTVLLSTTAPTGVALSRNEAERRGSRYQPGRRITIRHRQRRHHWLRRFTPTTACRRDHLNKRGRGGASSLPDAPPPIALLGNEFSRPKPEMVKDLETACT